MDEAPLIFFESGPDGGPCVFDAPREILLARSPDELPAAFAAIEKARRDGCFLAGYMSYELGHAFEARLAPMARTDAGVPLLCLGVFEAPAPASTTEALIARWSDADARVTAARPAWDFDAYRERFEAVMEYLRAGDVYQVNLTMPLELDFEGSAFDLFGHLRSRQPVPYGAYCTLGGPAILSRSPELFFSTDAAGGIRTRPMKGTMARGADPQTDAANRAFLTSDPKNRAENLMIVDLLRNDIARVSEIGTVRVPELFHVESYATVHQMVSLVTARLLRRLSLEELLRGLFPCGSVTGAPKIRAMEIIHELETGPRNAYCGAVGWVAPDDRMQFNVAIRTLSVFEPGRAVLNVGGGLVIDSTARSEYDECLLKARFAVEEKLLLS